MQHLAKTVQTTSELQTERSSVPCQVCTTLQATVEPHKRVQTGRCGGLASLLALLTEPIRSF